MTPNYQISPNHEGITVRSRKDGDDGFPQTSWWATTDREEFAKRQRENQARMQTSRFGKSSSLHDFSEGVEWKRKPQPVTSDYVPPPPAKGISRSA